MISVCMATYNGEKYIEEQLLSILHQTRQPDEVIICDDCSADATVEKIQGFIAQNGLADRWRLFQNKENKGYPGNFYYAMGLCRGDIVFLADQDDIWAREKIEHMYRILEKKKEMTVLACKFGLIDTKGAAIHSIMAPTRSRDTNKLRRVSLRDIFYKYEWPGMVLAYKREWFQTWVKDRKDAGFADSSKIPHDFLICTLAACGGQFYQTDMELAWHRRHENNVGREEHHFGKLLNKKRKLNEIESYLNLLQNLETENIITDAENIAVLTGKQSAMQSRYQALQSGKIRRVLKNALVQRKETRLKTVICDMLIVRGKE